MSQLNITNPQSAPVAPQGGNPTVSTGNVGGPTGPIPEGLGNPRPSNPPHPQVAGAMHNSPLPDPNTVSLHANGVNTNVAPQVGQQESPEALMRTAIRDLAARQGITVDDKDMPFVLKLAGQEIPALKTAMASQKTENVRTAIANAGEKLSDLVHSLPPRFAWEHSREERAKFFAFQSRLNEEKVQQTFLKSPHISNSLAEAWSALKDGARPAPGTEAFDAWFEKEVWTMLEGKLAAVKELRKANLPEGAAHDLMDKV
ncbi:MAG: hypothetical protein J5838_06125, partial [Desulfovibrio sp.]|nr:hypothetical protein [Desulfovibrio sp.]